MAAVHDGGAAFNALPGLRKILPEERNLLLQDFISRLGFGFAGQMADNRAGRVSAAQYGLADYAYGQRVHAQRSMKGIL